MIRVILHKGMFSSRTHRYCTQSLKLYPFRAYCRSLNEDKVRVVNVVGIRREEGEKNKTSRFTATEWEPFDGDAEVWRPIVEWRVDDVIAIHHRNNVMPNPLYLKGAARVGCWPCVFSRKSELRMLDTIDPERVAIIADLEQAVTDLAVDRYALKGETFESLGYGKPAYFQSVTRTLREKVCPDCKGPCEECKGLLDPFNICSQTHCPRCEGHGMVMGTSGVPMPIKEVVAWAYTARGSTEIEPFAPDPSDGGCMRWG